MGTILDQHHYKPKNIFNMDETGHGIGTKLPSPVKSHITSLVFAVETGNARNTVLEKENPGLRNASEARKGKRAEIAVGNLGTHAFSTEDCLERVREAEAVTTARKTKGNKRAVPVGTQHTLDDVHTVLGLLDYDVHGLDSFGDEY